MEVTRDGDTFEVMPHWSDFWQNHFATSWEPETKQVVERFCHGTGVFVDIGAWIGPVSLWAAKAGDDIVACEPDPEAFEQLEANLVCNAGHLKVTTIYGAISDHDGTALLGKRTAWNDSMSSLVGGTTDHIEVNCLTMESFLAGVNDIDLINMDIEGGEGIVIPQAEPFLAELGVPLCLSLHPQWWTIDPLPHLLNWKRENLTPDEALFYPPSWTGDPGAST
jgi:FkbM family methyltransferase